MKEEDFKRMESLLEQLNEKERSLHGLLKDANYTIGELKKVALSKGFEAGKFAEKLVTGALEKNFPRIAQEIDKAVERNIEEVNEEIRHLLHCLGVVAIREHKPPTIKEIVKAHDVLLRGAAQIGDEPAVNGLMAMKRELEKSLQASEDRKRARQQGRRRKRR